MEISPIDIAMVGQGKISGTEILQLHTNDMSKVLIIDTREERHVIDVNDQCVSESIRKVFAEQHKIPLEKLIALGGKIPLPVDSKTKFFDREIN